MEQVDEPSALFFDITGCAHLFGGEEHMAALVLHDFERVGYVVRVAVADTLGAAWAAVRFGRLLSTASPAAPIIIPCGRQQALMGPLPVAALRLPTKTIDTLHELGIRQITQLQALPRSTLPARFGAGVLERLDQAWGLIEELIVPVPPVEPIEAVWSFEEPTADRRALESVLQRLIGEIAETLAARQEGAQRLICRLLCVGNEPVQLTVGALQPTAAAEHLAELVRLQLERVTLAGEVLGVELEVVASGPLEWHQQEFFDAGVSREGERQLAVLLDRLNSRLGEKSVLRPKLCPDPQPEYAGRLEAVLAETNPKNPGAGTDSKRIGPPGSPGKIPNSKFQIPNSNLQFSIYNLQFAMRPASDSPGQTLEPTPGLTSGARHPLSTPVPDYQLITGPAVRPLCLKPRPAPIEVVSVVPDGPPVRFRWQRAEYIIAQSWGPERIDTGWWRGPHVERDYYRVETTTGQRFWLFRQNDTGKNNTGKWFLHGAFE
jgi:protein ImuB